VFIEHKTYFLLHKNLSELYIIRFCTKAVKMGKKCDPFVPNIVA